MASSHQVADSTDQNTKRNARDGRQQGSVESDCTDVNALLCDGCFAKVREVAKPATSQRDTRADRQTIRKWHFNVSRTHEFPCKLGPSARTVGADVPAMEMSLALLSSVLARVNSRQQRTAKDLAANRSI